MALDGGWRIFRSGAGIAHRLVLQRLLGLDPQQHRLGLDPALSAPLDGLPLATRPGHNRYRAAGVWLDVDTLRKRLVGGRQIVVTLG